MLRKLLRRLASPSHATAERLIVEGNRLEDLGDAAAACHKYRAALTFAPGHAGGHLNLGIGLEKLGNVDAALASYETALRLDPASPYVAYNLAKLLHGRGLHARAGLLLRAALERKPTFPEASVVLSSVLEAQGRPLDATAALEQALSERPDYAEAHYLHGNALVRLERPEDALASYRKAVELQPQFAAAWCNLGNVLGDLGRADEARRCLARALELEPASADALIGMGNLHAAAEEMQHAAELYRRALAIDPGIAQAQVNLGNALKYQGNTREALECFRAALALDPGSAHARWSAAMCHAPTMREAGDDLVLLRSAFSTQLDALDRWFDAGPRRAGAAVVGTEQPFWLAYQEENNRDLLQRYGRLCARLMASWQEEQGLRPGQRRTRGPVRVGIVSQYFREHSVWNAIVKGWFQQLDPERFAIAAFCLGTEQDGETRYASSRAARFEQGARGLRGWAETIIAAQPEVLIYPEIGMDPMTVRLASLRLAPVQAVAWGHPETSGLPTMDFYLSAQDLEPANAQDNYTERLFALPHLGCYVEPASIEAAPERDGIEPAVPLLVCPGTPFKYAPEYDWIFPEIARRLGRCRFLFFTHRSRALSEKLRLRLADAFQRSGLDMAQHASFIPWQEKSAFYGRLRGADVFLDTIGFSGFNTALQAVECGLPIVTREGRFMRGRLASGILRRLGLAELVADSQAQYVELVVKLANDRSYREDVRRQMAERRALLFADREPIGALEAFLEGLR